MLKSHLESAETPWAACGDSQSDQVLAIAYEMAYGLSHELNNPLANIAGRARLLAEQESDPEKRHQLAIIVDQAMRGCEMIADLMLFARPPQWQPEPLNVSTVLQQLCLRAQEMAEPRGITLRTDLADAGEISADRHALAEAFWAVLRNAIEAAQTVVCVRSFATCTAQAGSSITIEIEDDGPGLSDQALQLAFHPYFSGREAGRGLGLGLSKARRIVSLCPGTITLSNPAQGGCLALIKFTTG